MEKRRHQELVETVDLRDGVEDAFCFSQILLEVTSAVCPRALPCGSLIPHPRFSLPALHRVSTHSLLVPLPLVWWVSDRGYWGQQPNAQHSSTCRQECNGSFDNNQVWVCLATRFVPEAGAGSSGGGGGVEATRCTSRVYSGHTVVTQHTCSSEVVSGGGAFGVYEGPRPAQPSHGPWGQVLPVFGGQVFVSSICKSPYKRIWFWCLF